MGMEWQQIGTTETLIASNDAPVLDEIVESRLSLFKETMALGFKDRLESCRHFFDSLWLGCSEVLLF